MNQYELYPLPNRIRSDGSAWYFDPILKEIIFFDDEEDELSLCNSDEKLYSWESAIIDSNNTLPAGAIFHTTRDVSKGEELFFDYSLSESSLPKWAEGWYEPIDQQ